ncbi:hypothetical protein ABPG72_017090 [Tetrahymena utriculariae]
MQEQDQLVQAIEEKGKKFLSDKGYTVQQLIGKGSFGRVYKAHDYQNNRIVAIKALIPNYQNAVAGVLENLVKSYSEIQNASSINSQHVIKIYNSYIDKELFVIFIAQEFCSKGNLNSYMKGIPNPSQNVLKNIIKQILQAIMDTHNKQIIHSDIKPENILVDEREVIKIGDFGEAKQLQKNKNSTQAIGASPIFAAPEVNKEGEISYESDYYSVGAVICIISGLQFKHLEMIQVGVLPDVSYHNNKYFLLLAFNMMSQDPKKRASCSKVLNLLEQTNTMDSKYTHSILMDLSTQCNQDALSFFKQSNQVGQSQGNQNNLIDFTQTQLKNKCIHYIFWTLCIVLPLFQAGVSIYFMTKSCFIFQHLTFVVICFLLSYFSATSLLTNALKLLPNRANSFIEFILNFAFVASGTFLILLILHEFPCKDMYICTSFIDIPYSEIIYNRFNTNSTTMPDNKFYSLCKMEDPDRRYSIEEYFEQNYSSEIEITYYQTELTVFQILYPCQVGLMCIWILLRFLNFFFPNCILVRCCDSR